MQRGETPFIASVFIRLPNKLTKHRYDFSHSPRVDAPFRLFCGEPDCKAISRSRSKLSSATEVVHWSYESMSGALARELNVSEHVLHRAANRSVHALHCPSAEIIVIWLAKFVAVKLTMEAHPERAAFGWVDAGWNVYRVRRIDPPPPPWFSFWPVPGAIAMARLPGACHNELRGTNYSACPMATFLYGDTRAWRRLLPRYFRHVRHLVLAAVADGSLADGPRSARAMLCSEQDVYQDLNAADGDRTDSGSHSGVTARAPTPLFDEFQTSKSGENWGGWGWEGVAPCPEIGRGAPAAHRCYAHMRRAGPGPTPVPRKE